MRYLALVFFLLTTSAHAAEVIAPAPAPSCEQSLASDELTRDISLLWYPSSVYKVLTHMELEVDGDMWSGVGVTYKSHAFAAAEKAARRGRPFVRFHIRVSEREFASLKDDLIKNNGKFTFNSCSGGNCAAIAKNTEVKVPRLIAFAPTLTMAYVSLKKALGDRRVGAIEWVGPERFRDYVRVKSVGFVGAPLELFALYYNLSGTLRYLIYTLSGFTQLS